MIKFNNLLAGKATFTVSNDSGSHYTFRINKKDGNRGPMYFVKLLTGSDNMTSYTYMGMVNATQHRAYPTKASKYNKDSLVFKVLNWALNIIAFEKDVPEGYEILPSGTCFKCGRKLTTPESIKSGLGPHCRKMVG